ncbi:hypothetical protein [Curtobacterium sp. MCPF17_052]|uniref:hypothetical protein n=1 Tax=Curtobacterium sp. MCPF17_052 TaxID=2175655 RepID=UPI0024E023BA|nr:hypothetical protein [Curtobacterium sp. MCPF17_052]WIB13768.1 hypothetical protein DEJ36_08935 [Curtobacterium sp. MCPF17_052]
MDTQHGREARITPAEHARLLADRTDRHTLTLESVLAVLRSPRVGDAAARAEAVEIASAALVDLRTSTDRQREVLLEPVAGAFSRLRADLRPLVRFGDLDVQFVEPPRERTCAARGRRARCPGRGPDRGADPGRRGAGEPRPHPVGLRRPEPAHAAPRRRCRDARRAGRRDATDRRTGRGARRANAGGLDARVGGP